MNRQYVLQFLLIVIVFRAYPQLIKEMEFVDRPVKEILMTIAEATGTSIITDNTVKGNASYHFENTDLDKALESFLDSCNLYCTKRNEVYYISAVYLNYNRENELLTAAAMNIPPGIIISRISHEIGITILFDPFPDETVTINADNLQVGKILEIVTARFDGYRIEEHGGYYYIRKIPVQDRLTVNRTETEISVSEGLYSVKGKHTRLNSLLSDLFRKSGREYLLLKKGDTMLEDFSFSNKSFDRMLRLILELAGGDFTVKNRVYYIFDVSRNEVYNRIEDNGYIRLKHISARILPGLIPRGISGSISIKTDNDNNAVILSGPSASIKLAIDFIKKMEEEYSHRVVRRINLSYLTAAGIIKLLPDRLKTVHITFTGDPNSMIAESDPEAMSDFISFINSADKSGKSYPVRLKYIRSNDLMRSLPPSAGKNCIKESGTPSLIFFQGSQERYTDFLKELEYVDRPAPQIKYELLVVQYQESSSSDFSFSFKDEIYKPATRNSVIASLGNLIGLNIDIVSVFGYQFAVDLNAKLSKSKARILADTTLNSLTGEETTFQNTNTFRYRDMQIDPDTGKEIATGITREITSGLMININGWISGDGMITMDVKTTISKRGADVSSGSSNPPPTSEKIISTHVRTPSGRPVVIGGLFQKEDDRASNDTPLLNKIPILGKLFSARKNTFEKNEMNIYIIPRIEYTGASNTEQEYLLWNYYDIFFKNTRMWQ